MPLVPNKREFLARRMRDFGMLALLEKWARRPGLVVLTYHRVGTPADYPEYYGPILSATPEAFRAQMKRLRDTFRVVRLEEAVTLAESGFETREPLALVTFDDGHVDNVTTALPVLRDLGVPAAFFLPTAFIDAPRLPWWDHVACALSRSKLDRLRLDLPEAIDLELPAAGPRTAAIARVIRACLDHRIDMNPDVERAFLDHLDARAGVEVDSPGLGRTLFMGWDDARRLTGDYAVGSHAHTHRPLGVLPSEVQADELTRSKAVLEDRLGRPVEALAYPYGWAAMFDAETERLAAGAGYKVAFAAVEGYNRPGATDRFAVRRLNVGFSDTPVLLRARAALRAATGRSFV